MTDATELDEAGIRARLEAATPGPWEAFDANEGDGNYRPGWMVANDAFHNPPEDPDAPWIAVEVHVGTRHDAEFIAHARTDVGLLLTALDEARDQRDSVQFALDGFRSVARRDNEHLITRAEAAEREVRRLRGVCEDWGSNYQSWVDATRAAEARAESAEAQVERLHFDLDREARARQAAEGALAAVRQVCAEPDDTQWWPVQPYMDPHDEDEVVEVQVVAVDRVLAALATPTTTGSPLSAEAAELLSGIKAGDPEAVAEVHRLMDEDPLPILSPEEEAEVTRRTEEIARARAQGAANGGGYFIGGATPTTTEEPS